MSISNPFDTVGPIADPQLFFNRKVSVETLLNSLLSGKPGCRSIVGQRKIGKSSLVQYISHPTTTEEYRFEGSRHIFLHFNCQKHTQALKSFNHFYQVLLDQLSLVISGWLDENTLRNLDVDPLLRRPPNSTLPHRVGGIYASVHRSLEISTDNLIHSYNREPVQVWDSVLQELWKHGYHLILIFDEFDKAVMREELIREGVFGSLRGYANDTPNFGWVTCTNRFLHILFEEAFDEYGITRAQRISESDFYNLAPAHVVGLFSKEDIHNLILSLLKPTTVTFSPEDIDFVVKCGGCFPYFVQRACYHLYNTHRTGCIQYEAVVQDFIRESIPIWEGFWSRLDRNHQLALSSIADGHVNASTYELNDLQNKALVYIDQNGQPNLFSEEFKQFVLSTKRLRGRFPAQVGRLINDRYKVIAVKVTDHSEVVKARDEKLNRTIAIKLVRVNEQSDDDILQLRDRLEREAHILASLKHPAIGAIYDILAEPLGIVMEWVEGVPLQELLQKQKQFPETDVVRIGVDLADALSYVHERKIVHRDIKPANIIVTESGKAILIDFDIARSYSQQTISLLADGTRGYLGTKTYSAPEQLLVTEDLGAPSDLFALGVVLYQMLTGRLPYEYGNLPSLYDGHFSMPEQFNISEPLYHTLCGLLREAPNQRLSAATLKDELESYLAHLKASGDLS